METPPVLLPLAKSPVSWVPPKFPSPSDNPRTFQISESNCPAVGVGANPLPVKLLKSSEKIDVVISPPNSKAPISGLLSRKAPR